MVLSLITKLCSVYTDDWEKRQQRQQKLPNKRPTALKPQLVAFIQSLIYSKINVYFPYVEEKFSLKSCQNQNECN